MSTMEATDKDFGDTHMKIMAMHEPRKATTAIANLAISGWYISSEVARVIIWSQRL